MHTNLVTVVHMCKASNSRRRVRGTLTVPKIDFKFFCQVIFLRLETTQSIFWYSATHIFNKVKKTTDLLKTENGLGRKKYRGGQLAEV